MNEFDTVDNYYILAFAYRVYDAKWVKEGLILENNPNDVTAISEYDIYQAAYSYTLDLIKKNQSNLIWTKSALEKFASELHKKILAHENL